ncbi:Vomp family autotransporter, partial [Bartonella pachyuromydis]|uniref:Vomp family autotransporter n=1 Tax=Bartonella pachyuromydis TaxID=931097 RepID=UPI0031EC3766
GGAKYENGQWIAPSFKVNTVNAEGQETNETYQNVAEALTGVGASFTNIQNKITNEITQQINHLQSDDSAVVHYDKKDEDEIDYTNVTLGKGKDSSPVALHNVSDGSIANGSHDAVTGGQINKIGEDVAKFLGGEASFEKGAFTGPTYKLSSVDANGKVTDNSFNDVGSAFAGLDTNIKNVNNNLTNKYNELTQNIANITQEVQGDALLWNKEEGAFVAQHGEKRSNSKITHLLDGNIASGSTDAVNGSQLYTMSNTLASYLGGGSGYENGQWKAPSFKVTIVSADGSKVEEQSYDDVAKAFAGIGTSFTNIHKELKNEINQIVGDSLVKQDEDSKVIKIGAETGGTSINITNSVDASRTLTGVKAGALTEESLDAVNGSQLYTMSNTLASYLGGGAGYKEGKWVAPSFKVTIVSADGSKVEEQSYDDIAKAFAGVGTSFTNIHKELKNEINQIVDDSLVKQDKDSKVIKIGSEKEGTEITVANSSGVARSISGVKAATKGDEAVNKEQFDKGLKDLSNSLQSEDSSVVLYDKKENGDTDYTSVTFGKGEKISPVALHNVSDGSIANDSHDAVTGGQINKIGEDVAKFLGGEASFEKGAFTGPTYKLSSVDANGKVTDNSFNDVGSAFAGLDTNIKNVNNNLTNKYNELTQNIANITQEVQGDALLWNKEEGAFVAQHGEKRSNSKITHLLDGNIASGSTDAVNGSQLYTMSNTLASYLGGGSGYENGTWTAPIFKVLSFKEDGSSEETIYNDVAAAFAGVNNSFTKLHHELSDNVEQNALLWSEADEAFVAVHGKGDDKRNSKLSHLVDGDISAGSTEAITGNQLYSLNQTLALYLGGGASYVNGEWIAPHFAVTQFQSDGSSTGEKSYDNVAGAFEGVNDSMKNINDRINNVEQTVSTNGLNWNETEQAFDARHDGVDSKITHVADGDVSKGSKDAVNGGQLWETNKKVEAVEDRVESIDQHVKDIENTVTNDAVKYDKGADGKKSNKITLVGGNESEPVLIDNVADGRIESGSKEAVNGGQLHDYTDQQMKLVLDDAKKYTDERVTDIVNNGVNESKAYTDMKFETLNYAVEDVRKEARQAAAIGLAVSNLRYYDIPGSLSVSFGTGVWRSQSAFAIGAGYTSEDGNIRSNVSVTSAGGHWGVGAGITLRLR